MAPEIYNRRKLGKEIDVFAFGTMLFEMFAKSVPYDGLDPGDIMKKVLKGLQLQDSAVPPKVIKLVNKCREVEPKNRPTF